MASGLGTGMNLVLTGIRIYYQIPTGLALWVGLGVFTIVVFTSSSYLGLEKGIRRLAKFNSYIFYGLLVLLFFAGPTVNILRLATAGMAEWLQNFYIWGLDPIDIGGEALTQWWSLFDWAM
jgi:choline-glycine betaine transporter